MRIRPTIALISIVGEIWKVSKIHNVALYYILLSLLSR